MNNKFLIYATLSLTLCGLAAQEKNPVEYMETVTKDFEAIQKETWDYTKAIARGRSAKKIDKRRLDLIAENKSAKSRVSRLPNYKDDPTLKSAVVDYLRINNIMLVEDYGKIVNLEQVAEESFDAMEAYLTAKELASTKQDSIYQNFRVAYEAFAEKYNINLINPESKRTQKLNIASKVFEYYNDVYLVFFKSYKQELYLMDAISNTDLAAIEQNRATLIKFSKEGLENLKEMGSFNNDKSLIEACTSMLNFYIGESEKYVPQMVDFFKLSTEFEKKNKAINSKKSSQLSKVEVDDFNKLVNKYNNSVNEFNSMNELLNKERSKRINSFNKTTDNFLNNQVPR